MLYSRQWPNISTRVAEIRKVAAIAQAIAADVRLLRNGTPSGSRDPLEVISSSSPKRAIRVFVTWAHSDEDWDSSQALSWERQVIGFTTSLRRLGIDADVDLYHTSDPSIDWTRFGQSGVASADFSVIVYSKGWGQRWSGSNTPTLGTGAVVEADTLKGLMQEDQASFQRTTLLVRLPGPGRARIPADLNRLNRFSIDPEDLDTFEPLLRTLTGQPVYEIPEVGTIPTLPSTVTEGINMRRRVRISREFSDYEAVLGEVEKVQKDLESDADASAQRRLATLMGLLDALSH